MEKKELINFTKWLKELRIDFFNEMTPTELVHRYFEETAYCNPPNITYCKRAINPDYDCSKCEWIKFRNKLLT